MEKTGCSFPKSLRVRVPHTLGMKLLSQVPFPCWDLFYLVFTQAHSCCLSYCELIYIAALLSTESPATSQPPTASDSCTFFILSFTMILKSLEEGCGIYVPLKAENLHSLMFCTLVGCILLWCQSPSTVSRTLRIDRCINMRLYW